MSRTRGGQSLIKSLKREQIYKDDQNKEAQLAKQSRDV